MVPIKLVLGAGQKRYEGFTHLDKYPFPGIDIVADVTKGIPLEDNSVDLVMSEDFLEHIPPEAKIPLMNEIWRILVNGGIMQHVIPLAGSVNDFGSPSHLSHWHPQQFEHFDVDSYRYVVDHEYEGFKGGFKKVSSVIAPDQQTFRIVMKAVK